MPERSFITDLAPNELVEGVFTIQNTQLGMTRNGKPFLKCLLADRTGRVPGRMWNTSEQLFKTLPTNGFVRIEGQTQPYQGELQIIVRSIEQAQPSAEDLHDLLPSTERDVDDMLNRLSRKLEEIRDDRLRALAQAYLNDQDLMRRFKQAPAAMTLHHAYLGGLLEHTLGLVKLAEAVVPLYPGVNRDLVLMGLFLHDLGKCAELTWDAGFDYSDDGRLIGHVARGVIWLEDKVRDLRQRGTELPDELVRVLQHIILSHHGQAEFGALKIPSTPEAIMVHMLDNVDAKVHMALAARDGGSKAQQLGGNFTEKIWALGTRIYRADPLATPEPADEPEEAAEESPVDDPAAQLTFGQQTDGKGGI